MGFPSLAPPRARPLLLVLILGTPSLVGASVLASPAPTWHIQIISAPYAKTGPANCADPVTGVGVVPCTVTHSGVIEYEVCGDSPCSHGAPGARVHGSATGSVLVPGWLRVVSRYGPVTGGFRDGICQAQNVALSSMSCTTPSSATGWWTGSAPQLAGQCKDSVIESTLSYLGYGASGPTPVLSGTLRQPFTICWYTDFTGSIRVGS